MALNKETLQQWRNKYLIIVYDSDTLKEYFKFKMSKLNIATLLILALLFAGMTWFFLFKYSFFRDLIGYQSDPEMKRSIVYNAERMDSLEAQIRIRDQYYDNLKRIIRGEVPVDKPSKVNAQALEYEQIEFAKSKHDSVLRKQIEDEEQLNLSFVDGENRSTNSLQSLHFFVPIRGIITNAFNAGQGHLGIDIVAEANKPILSTLAGTVVYADWSMETGYVIEIQHENNLISFYKHNSSLLKKVGDRVKAGESIAIIGNSGELTTGPHLHFEIWMNGVAINPENYVVF
ncbi:MAG: hypothetical protein RIS47_944 [Bacteroidota bacterium]|jgi:murein DD-endopeptidase MepM/ murein hydrolase activator NlpD